MQRRLSLCLASLTLLLSACGGSPAPEPVSEARAPLARWQDESFGPLHLGVGVDALVAAFGEPESRAAFVEMEATGERVAHWSWPEHGVMVSLVESTEGATLTSFALASPSALRASWGGVGLGSRYEDVLAAYAEVSGGDEPRVDADRPGYVRIGDRYECLSFTFVDGAVTEIFLGATGAE